MAEQRPLTFFVTELSVNKTVVSLLVEHFL
jgi:hypothetical protein